MPDFSKEELARYNRQIILPSFGPEAQQKLKAARVLVVGAGGLGSPLLLYLAAAGVGTLGIIDFDHVDDSNLHRQVLFNIQDIGQPKADAAKKHLLSLNPFIHLVAHNEKLSSANAIPLFSQYDIIADGSDNFPTRYLVNDACVIAGKPNVYGAVFQFEGQVSVFNHNDGPNYRDLFPTPPQPGIVPDCATGGVLGVLPGIIGSLQALEVIKLITGIGQPLSGQLYIFDALRFESKTFKIQKAAPPITELIDYEAFCNPREKTANNNRTHKEETTSARTTNDNNATTTNNRTHNEGNATKKNANNAAANDSNKTIKVITPAQLLHWQSTGKPFQLIDVREPHEYQQSNIGAILIPLPTLKDNTHRIPKDIDVVIHCQSGARSAKAIQQLQKEGYENLYNLHGGILAYQKEANQK